MNIVLMVPGLSNIKYVNDYEIPNDAINKSLHNKFDGLTYKKILINRSDG